VYTAPSVWEIPLGILAVFVIAVAIGYRVSAGSRGPTRASKLAKRLGLPLDAEIMTLIRPIWRRQVGSAGIGGVAGGLVGAAIEIALGGTDEPVDSYWVLGGLLAGGAIGTSISALAGEFRRNPSSTRIARSSAVAMRDFVPTSQLNSARVLVGLTTTSTVLNLLFGDHESWSARTVATRALPLAMTILSVALLLLFEVSGRRVVQRSRPAGSELELAWDDGLRASALQQMIAAPTYLAIYPVFVTMGVWNLTGWQIAFQVVIYVAYLVALIMMLLTAPEQQFRRRLWPDIAARNAASVGGGSGAEVPARESNQ